MKTIFRVLMLGIMMSAVTTVSVFAQDVCAEIEAKQALYKKFTDNYAGTLDQKKSAVEAGDQYIGKYGACADDKAIVDYLNTHLPTMKTFIKTQEGNIAKGALYKSFDTAVDASNVPNVFSTGKAILAKEPEFLDVTLALANSGFDQIEKNPTVTTYNEDVLNYSRTGLQQIEAGKKSQTEGYGAKQYSYKTDKYPDGKNNALGALNYNIGYIMYYRQGKDNPAKKKEALPYFYKSTQYNSFAKNFPLVYQTIGAWYLDEAIRIDGERQKLIIAADNKDTPETLAMLGMQKGYADRAIDAYARAYSLAKADPKNKPYADTLYAKLKELYNFRYNGKTEGIDQFVATVMSKPMPAPTTEVTPVTEAVPATTTTTSGAAKQSSMTSDDTSTSATDTTDRGKATTTKTSVTTDPKTTPSGTTTTTKPKTVVKKPAPKKKGTR